MFVSIPHPLPGVRGAGLGVCALRPSGSRKCVTWARASVCPHPQFPHLQNGADIGMRMRGVSSQKCWAKSPQMSVVSWEGEAWALLILNLGRPDSVCCELFGVRRYSQGTEGTLTEAGRGGLSGALRGEWIFFHMRLDLIQPKSPGGLPGGDLICQRGVSLLLTFLEAVLGTPRLHSYGPGVFPSQLPL